jgi:hypothetical protein
MDPFGDKRWRQGCGLKTGAAGDSIGPERVWGEPGGGFDGCGRVVVSFFSKADVNVRKGSPASESGLQ